MFIWDAYVCKVGFVHVWCSKSQRMDLPRVIEHMHIAANGVAVAPLTHTLGCDLLVHVTVCDDDVYRVYCVTCVRICAKSLLIQQYKAALIKHMHTAANNIAVAPLTRTLGRDFLVHVTLHAHLCR